MSDALLTHDQAAGRIGVCSKTLRQIRQQGLIRYVAVSPRKIFYRPEDCDAYLESVTRFDVPQRPTARRSGRRLRTEQNVVSFTAQRRERLAARGV